MVFIVKYSPSGTVNVYRIWDMIAADDHLKPRN